MSQFYTDPRRASDKWSLPDAEVFYADDLTDDDDEPMDAGYYYWHCFPGCLPDSDPIGPFDTEEAAIEDARADLDLDDEDED